MIFLKKIPSFEIYSFTFKKHNSHGQLQAQSDLENTDLIVSSLTALL